MSEEKKAEENLETKPKAEAAPKPKTAKVKVLRPFRIRDAEGNPVVYERIGSVVEVPKADVPWLTKKNDGQARGFGHTFEAENADRHNMQRAELVA